MSLQLVRPVLIRVYVNGSWSMKRKEENLFRIFERELLKN
jgi:hypothetical protein